jgi:transcription elongation factor Elf1
MKIAYNTLVCPYCHRWVVLEDADDGKEFVECGSCGNLVEITEEDVLEDEW